ncbi:hypothetical protein BW14_11870 [Bifidobacterium sp. UTBIF-68]|uniref:hypothetical protein n=1 Tax=Bifidobacterium TaxID=1678 RepID=UPI0015E2C479|nr:MULTISPECIES: hypothetical protein [Bifidobacterium]TPF91631.1 hypothetical protein BW14_11870 [Bifidobacterium sp. UTBIF-68]
MTAVESLPAYASAEAVAKRKGDNLISIINAYLAGYASAGAPINAETTGKTLHALPSDTVLRTDADFDAFEREVLGDD